MRHILIPNFCFFLATLTLQAADSPSPKVETALRQRAQEFFQLEMDGKYRQAEALVARDSKDFYYESKKPDIKEFKIGAIHYGPGFSTAEVTLTSKLTIIIPGTRPRVMDVPFSSKWRLDGGKWCWYVNKEALKNTPFGREGSPGGTGGDNGPPTLPLNRVTASDLQKGVTLDKQELRFAADDHAPQKVTVKNNLPGPLTLQVITMSPALTIALAQPTLPAGGTVDVTVAQTDAAGPKPDKLELLIQPTGQSLSIPIIYAAEK